MALPKTDTCDRVQPVVQMLCPPREMLVWLCVHHSISHRLGQYGTARAAVSALIAYLLSGKVLDKVVAARGLVLIALHMSCKPRNEGVGLKI